MQTYQRAGIGTFVSSNCNVYDAQELPLDQQKHLMPEAFSGIDFPASGRNLFFDEVEVILGQRGPTQELVKVAQGVIKVIRDKFGGQVFINSLGPTFEDTIPFLDGKTYSVPADGLYDILSSQSRERHHAIFVTIDQPEYLDTVRDLLRPFQSAGVPIILHGMATASR